MILIRCYYKCPINIFKQKILKKFTFINFSILNIITNTIFVCAKSSINCILKPETSVVCTRDVYSKTFENSFMLAQDAHIDGQMMAPFVFDATCEKR